MEGYSGTFEWKYASLNESTNVRMRPKPTSTGGKEVNFRNTELVGGIKSEAHVAVGDYAADVRIIRRTIESSDEVQERWKAVLS